MKMKHLIFALLTAASASLFTGCNESTPTPEEPINDDYHMEFCNPCKDEKVVDTLTNQEATVVLFNTGHPNSENLYILSTQYISKIDTTYYLSIDSLLLTCPTLPKEYRQTGKKVVVDVSRTNCTGVLTWIDTNPGFGRKIQILSIQSK